MRINNPVTNRCQDYNESQIIVSTTNTKGVIDHVNDDFIAISGFTQDELIGQAHNIVRHPTMPQAAFKELWDHCKADKPWMGIVKNRCKNGDHYWVDAFVSPMFKNGEKIGFQSVRLKPSAEHVRSAEQTYWENPQRLSRLWRKATSLPLQISLLIGFFGINLIGLSLVSFGMNPFLTGLITLTLCSLLAAGIARPWKQFAASTRELFNSPIAQEVYTQRFDELGQIQLAFKFMHAQKDTLLYRIHDASGHVGSRANAAHTNAEHTAESVRSLSNEVKFVADAMHELSQTIQSIARNIGTMSHTVETSKKDSELGKTILTDTRDTITTLDQAMENSSQIIQQLNQDSERIGGVVDVINGIAEQTNLLALNAAIEAARAGEQGRGFAVVADEVRSLAAKTQESTYQIRNMIESLQAAANSAVKAINGSLESVGTNVSNINRLEKQFATILDNTVVIRDMCLQIATATDEQSAVSEEISKTITNINALGESTVTAINNVSENNAALLGTAQSLDETIRQFQKT